MKKILLGTTALVSVGLLAGPALASDPLKVTIGGNIVTGIYAIDHDDVAGTTFQDSKVALVARNIDIKAEGTLDNGLVAGVDAKLQLDNDWNTGNSPFASFRQLFGYLEGGFGRFEIGGTDGAAYKMHYTSPWFVPGNGVDSPNILNVNGSIATAGGLVRYTLRHSTFSLLASDANKISYFTPRLAGFQLGASFTPDNSVNGPSANGIGVPVKTFPGVGAFPARNVYELALNYAGTFGGVDLGADGFYTSGDASFAAADSPEEYGFGTNIGYAGFTLGGAWYQSKNIVPVGISAAASGDWGAQVWTAGLKYATGPWTVGVAYLNTEEDGTAPVGVASDAKIRTWQVGGGYNLGSGVDLGLDVQFSNVKPGAGVSDYDSKSAGLVLAFAF